MATLETAIEIANKAHAGVKDHHGEPYILHPLRVMFGVRGTQTRIVAVLHDVVEDSDTTHDDIKQLGFSADVLEALKLVTHEADESYTDYVVACKANPIAREVKLSDLRDNSSVDRMLMRPARFEKDAARLQRYQLSYQFLLDEMSEDEYRQLMVRFE